AEGVSYLGTAQKLASVRRNSGQRWTGFLDQAEGWQRGQPLRSRCAISQGDEFVIQVRRAEGHLRAPSREQPEEAPRNVAKSGERDRMRSRARTFLRCRRHGAG